MANYNSGGDMVVGGLGTAGSPAGGVQSIQGVANGTAVAVSPGAPTSSSIVGGSNNGTATQTVTDMTGDQIPANKVFQGTVCVSASCQNPANTATGALHVEVSWVPGTSGTTARRVAAVNLQLAATTATATSGVWDAAAVSRALTLYAGTTNGKFQYTVSASGSVTGLQYDVSFNGTAL